MPCKMPPFLACLLATPVLEPQELSWKGSSELSISSQPSLRCSSRVLQSTPQDRELPPGADQSILEWLCSVPLKLKSASLEFGFSASGITESVKSLSHSGSQINPTYLPPALGFSLFGTLEFCSFPGLALVYQCPS